MAIRPNNEERSFVADRERQRERDDEGCEANEHGRGGRTFARATSLSPARGMVFTPDGGGTRAPVRPRRPAR